MPVYTYKCRNCGHEFEQRQRMSDDPLSDCPVCAGELRRVVNSVGIVFKGSGFYVTDNRNGSSASANGSSGTSSQKQEKEGKTEKAEEKNESANLNGGEKSKSKEGAAANP